MYVYPVHWQFGELDQHPMDRVLTHSELAPLRASLVPMEHCITRFFEECDPNKDKHITLKEWGHCFGIKEDSSFRMQFLLLAGLVSIATALPIPLEQFGGSTSEQRFGFYPPPGPPFFSSDPVSRTSASPTALGKHGFEESQITKHMYYLDDGY